MDIKPQIKEAFNIYRKLSIKTLTVLLICMSLCSFNSFAYKWIYNGGDSYYQNDDGSIVRNMWIGDLYYGSDGLVMKNTWTPDGHHVDEHGCWTGESIGNQQETSDWIGYYEDDRYEDNSMNQSIYIYYQDENELHLIKRSSSEDGWNVSDTVYYFIDGVNTRRQLNERFSSTLTKLNETTIMLRTDGGLFMDGAYHKKS